MLFFKTILSCLWASLALATPLPEPQSDPNALPDPRQVYIVAVAWNGSGCKIGDQADTRAVLSSDAQTLTMIYNNYIAQAGTGLAPTDGRKNCDINISVHIPTNFRYTISQTTFRGFAAFDSGCSGFVQAQYFFSGQTPTATATSLINGPVTGNYQKTEVVKAQYPQCNKPTEININSSIYVRCGAKGTGLLTVDTIDHTYQEQYRFSWQTCRS